jgi:acyl carrier protein
MAEARRDTMGRGAIGETIRAFLVERYPAARARPPASTDRLLENGILDSLGILDLVAYLEGEFAITVSDEELLPEHFETLACLSAFVERKRRDSC